MFRVRNGINSHRGVLGPQLNVRFTRMSSPKSEAVMISLDWKGEEKLGTFYFIFLKGKKVLFKTKTKQMNIPRRVE